MKKASIVCISIGILCFLGILWIDIFSGEIIFKGNVKTPVAPTTLKSGPIDFKTENKYEVSIEVKFLGKLDSDFKVNVVDKNATSAWSKSDTITGTSGNNISTIAIGYRPFKIKKDSSYVTFLKLGASKYPCKIDAVSLTVKKKTFDIPNIFLTFSMVIVLLGLCLLYMGVRKGHKKI